MGLFKRKDSDADMGLGDDGLGLGEDPLAQRSDTADPFSQPMGDPSMPQQPHAQPYEPMGAPAGGVDFSNPDINSVTGSPKPREREQDGFMPSQQPMGSTAGAGHMEKDLQIIIAKLDAVKSELDSLHQRVQRIERIAEADQSAREKRQQTYPRW